MKLELELDLEPNAEMDARDDIYSRGGSAADGRHQVSRWTTPPQRVLLVQNHEDERTREAMGRLLE